MVTRCAWVTDDEIYIRYHDEEWGRPTRDDTALFELLTLEAFQAGLSWLTILKRRGGFRAAFAGFDIDAVAAFDDMMVDQLVQDRRIIRHRGKIEATINNARVVQQIQGEFGSLDAYLWSFVDDEPIVNDYDSLDDLPSETERSRTLSRDLKKRGFKYVGATTCYAFMQASGMVVDHTTNCDWHPMNRHG